MNAYSFFDKAHSAGSSTAAAAVAIALHLAAAAVNPTFSSLIGGGGVVLRAGRFGTSSLLLFLARLYSCRLNASGSESELLQSSESVN